MSNPLEDAWGHLFDEYMLFKMETWSKRQEKKSIRVLVHRLRDPTLVSDEDDEDKKIAAVEALLRRQYMRNMPKFNALMKACSQYQLMNDGTIKATEDPKDSILHAHVGGSHGVGEINLETMLSLSLNAIYNEATKHVYEQHEAETDFITRQRDVAMLQEDLDGRLCHVCRGDGETFTPARYRANGDQIEGTGVQSTCKECSGEGYIRFGSSTMGRMTAARLSRWLADADNMGWKAQPTPREIDREMYNLKNPRDPERQSKIVRKLVERAYPDESPELEGGEPHVPSMDRLRDIAKERAMNKRLIGDPHNMSLPERLLELSKFRAKTIDILTWGMVEKFLYPQEGGEWVDAVQPNAQERQEHEEEVNRIQKAVRLEIEGLDLDSPVTDDAHWLRQSYERYLEDRRRYHDGEDISEDRIRKNAKEDFFENRTEAPLYQYFRPYVRELVKNHEMFTTNHKYLTEEGLDQPIGHKERRAAEADIIHQAKEWLLDVVHRSKNLHIGTMTAFDEEMREQDVDWKQLNFDRVMSSWELLGGSSKGDKIRKAILDLKLEHRDGTRESFLGNILSGGQMTGTFPMNALAQMSHTIYAHGTGLIGSKNNALEIETYLNSRDGGKRHEYVEQTHDIGGVDAIDPDTGELEEDRYNVDEDDLLEEDGALGDSPEETYAERDWAGADAASVAMGDKSTLTGLDPIAIPVGSHILDMQRDDIVTLTQKWHDHMGYNTTPPLHRPVRDDIYLELLHSALQKSARGDGTQIYQSRRTGELNKEQADELLRQLSGLPPEGPDRRFWLDRLIQRGQFRTGVKDRQRFGKQQTNYQDYSRMVTLRNILLDPRTGSVKNLKDVATHPDFQRLVSSDLRSRAMKGLTVKEKQQLSEALATEEYYKGTLQKCPDCDASGKSFATNNSCRNVVGELGSPDAVSCSGSNLVGANNKAGMLMYMHPTKPGTLEAKILYEKLQQELLGKTTYTNIEGDTVTEVGRPDPNHAMYSFARSKDYEKGLLERADEYDKKVAMRLGHMVLCPACNGESESDCAMCEGGAGPYAEEVDGKSYVADTRIIRDSHSRSSGISDYRSLVQLEAKQRAERRLREEFQFRGRETPHRAGINSSLINRMIPIDEGVNTHELHPILLFPELTREGGFLSPERVVQEWRKSGGDRDNFILKYRTLFAGIPQALEGKLAGGFGADVIERTNPENAVNSGWFQGLVDALAYEDNDSFEHLIGQIHQGDNDNRNMRLDEGLMERGACSTCEGSGYSHWPDGRINLHRTCVDCKGTKSEGVKNQILRNPAKFQGLSDEDIRVMFARGDLDYEHRGHRTVLDNAHINPTGRMCDTCQCGQHDVIRQGDHTTLSMMMKGRSATPPKRKFGEEEMQSRTRVNKPTRAPIFSANENLIPTRRLASAHQDKQQGLYTELFDLMNEVKALGKNGEYGTGIDPITKQRVEITNEEMHAKIERLVRKIRQQDVRDAWNERMGRKGSLPDLNVTVPAVHPEGHEKEGEPTGEDHAVDWRQIVGGLGMVNISALPSNIYDPSVIPEDVILKHPCPYCTRESMHKLGTDVPTLEDHMEEGRAQGLGDYDIECPLSVANFQKAFDESGGDPEAMKGIEPPQGVQLMADELLSNLNLEPHERDYQNLMRKLEPTLDEAWAKRTSHDPYTAIMKTLKPQQVLGIPIIQPIPPAIIMSARLSTMGGDNPLGRGNPMSPNARMNQMLPESLNGKSARLRTAEEALPHDDESEALLKRLLAMHIIEPNHLASSHGNPLGLFSPVSRDGGMSDFFRGRIQSESPDFQSRRVLWAMSVLRKNMDNMALTQEEKAEFRHHHQLKLEPFLNLEKDWREYLTPRIKYELMTELGLKQDDPVMMSIFHFPDKTISSGDTLFSSRFDEDVNWRGLEGEDGRITPLSFIFDALNRSALFDAKDETTAHFDADEHGFMQPYEHHPSVWGFFHEMSDLPNPELFHNWVAHERLDDSYNTITSGPNEGTSLWNVTGKSLGEIMEDTDSEGNNLMDILWRGITGGKGITRMKQMKVPEKKRPQWVPVQVLDGEKYPDMDNMLQLSDTEGTGLKGAWYHLRNEIIMRASFPEFSKESMRRAGQNMAPVGLNTLGTGSRCLSCQGHGVHHTVDEAAKWHASKIGYRDEDGVLLPMPTVAALNPDGTKAYLTEPDGSLREKRVPLPTKGGVPWRTVIDAKIDGGDRRLVGQVNWGHPDSMRFIREELRPRHLGQVTDEWDESSWDEYINELARHIPSLTDPEYGGMDNILPAHEFACVACQGTGHCGGCSGSGHGEHAEGVEDAIQDINMALHFMKNLGVGIIPGEDGKSRYQPRASMWIKPNDGAIGRLASTQGVGQTREPLPEEGPIMSLIGPDDREWTPGTEDEWLAAMDDRFTTTARRWAREQIGVAGEDSNAMDMLRTIGDITDPESLRHWAQEFYSRVLPTRGEEVEDPLQAPHAHAYQNPIELANQIIRRVKDHSDAQVGSFTDWKLQRLVHNDPLGYHKAIRGATGAKHGWPTGSFESFLSSVTGKRLADSATKKTLARMLRSEEPEDLAALMYSLSNKTRALEGTTLRPSWWTHMHESGFNQHDTVFPRGHFGGSGDESLLPRCEHPHCEQGFHGEVHQCKYCSGSGDMSHHHEGAEHTPCFVCDGDGVAHSGGIATHGPDKPGEFYNPHGHYCSHHHPIIQEKMHEMFEDAAGQKLRGHYRKIVGGDFARRLIKYTSMGSQELTNLMRNSPEAFPPEEFHDTGLSLSHLQGLMFIGFHSVSSHQTGQENDYLIPMFERNGSKFSIFDLGEGHVSDWQGIGRQSLFQKQFGADGVYLGRGIDYFDHPNWGDSGVVNPIGKIAVNNRGDDYNLDMGLGPDSPFDKNQYDVKGGRVVCPNCNHHLSTKSYRDRKCYTCGKEAAGCVCKESGETPDIRNGPEYYKPCSAPMIHSVHADSESEGKCNWPGGNYDRKFKKEVGFKHFNRERFAREYLIGRTSGQPPAHVIERMQRERLRERMEAIAKGEVDPAIDPKTGKLNLYPKKKYILMTDHEGNAIRYPKEHPMNGQPVYRSIEMPVDEPLCTWYKFNGIPTLHGLYDTRLGSRMTSKSFCDAFYQTLIPYNRKGDIIYNDDGQPDISPKDIRSYEQLQYLLRELPQGLKDSQGVAMDRETTGEKENIRKGGLHVRIPVMHAGFGSSLGHAGKLEDDGYQGLTNPQSLLSLIHKVNEKLKISTFKAAASGKELMAKIASVDHLGKFDELHKIGRINPDTGNWMFESDFVGWVSSLERSAEKKKDLDKGMCKELQRQYDDTELHRLFANHSMNEHNKRMMIRQPRGQDMLSVDEDLTAYTITDTDLANRYLSSMVMGDHQAEPLTKEGADPAWVNLVTGTDHGLRPHPLTFGIRPDMYHTVVEQHAEEAHNAALEFQVTHFPFQASLEAGARGEGVSRIVREHLQNMPVLDATHPQHVLGDSPTVPKIAPDDDKQWFVHTGQLSPEARERAEKNALSEWEGDEFREGFGDTSSAGYEERYNTDTGDLS